MKQKLEESKELFLEEVLKIFWGEFLQNKTEYEFFKTTLRKSRKQKFLPELTITAHDNQGVHPSGKSREDKFKKPGKFRKIHGKL